MRDQRSAALGAKKQRHPDLEKVLRSLWVPVVFALWIGALHLWNRAMLKASQVESLLPEDQVSTPFSRIAFAEGPLSQAAQAKKSRSQQYLVLLEYLDRVVAYEHYYRSIYGSFTAVLSRIGAPTPPEVAEFYEVQVLQASRDRLLVRAISDAEGHVSDWVWMDQDFRLKTNFPLPVPSEEYLRLQAQKHLRAYQEEAWNPRQPERTLFSGYFRYEKRPVSGDSARWVAVGIRSPVVGMKVELEGAITGRTSILSENRDPAQLLREAEMAYSLQSSSLGNAGSAGSAPRGIGEWSGSNHRAIEEVYLAQKIFRAERGREASHWGELTEVAQFGVVNRMPASKKPEKDSGPRSEAKGKSQAEAGGSGRGLEIEPDSGFEIEPDSN